MSTLEIIGAAIAVVCSLMLLAATIWDINFLRKWRRDKK